jgi:peptide/nickel transport system permease protein
MADAKEPAIPPPPPLRRRPVTRRSPRVAQFLRTWYFLRRNTLAMVGLGILLLMVGVALYALTLPLSYQAMTVYCATSQQSPNTYTGSTGSIAIVTGTQNGLPNGTYGFVVTSPKNYIATPTTGTFTVAGAAVLVNISFTPGTSTAAGQSPGPSAPGTNATPFSVTFQETGLSTGTTWSVELNNTSPSVCTPGYRTVCTYPSGSTPPGPGCYQTPPQYLSIIPPTLSFSPFGVGPLPMGSLTQNPTHPYFYNIWEGELRGADWSLLISISIVGAGAVAGLLIGAISGTFGGVVDEVLMRIVDIFLSIPQILLVIVLIAAVTVSYPSLLGLGPFDTRIFLLIVAFTITWWPFYARIVRGQVLVTREQKYVEAARASGAGRGRLIVRHIIPNSVFPVLIQMSLDVGTVPLFVGTLVFLGFAIFPTAYFPEWGSLSALSVGQGASSVLGFLNTCQLAASGIGTCLIPWWQLLFPGFVLFFYALSVNFLSDGLRDALDPRLRR